MAARSPSGTATRGCRAGSVRLRFTGTAGQSFGAFTCRGMHLELEGEANDYVGKGLSGGEITIRPFRRAAYADASHQHLIIGNTVLYGATAGKLFAAGQAGDRFAVRNSGAVAVIEGAGNHCCEYMTGGIVVVLGRAGRNFGAGMSNGVAYVLDEAGTFETRVNKDMVELVTLDGTTSSCCGGWCGSTRRRRPARAPDASWSSGTSSCRCSARWHPRGRRRWSPLRVRDTCSPRRLSPSRCWRAGAPESPGRSWRAIRAGSSR